MDFKCLDCGYIGEPTKEEVYENCDADGHRGEWVTYLSCWNCGGDELSEDTEEHEEGLHYKKNDYGDIEFYDGDTFLAEFNIKDNEFDIEELLSFAEIEFIYNTLKQQL